MQTNFSMWLDSFSPAKRRMKYFGIFFVVIVMVYLTIEKHISQLTIQIFFFFFLQKKVCLNCVIHQNSYIFVCNIFFQTLA